MLRLQPFDIHFPNELSKALHLLKEFGPRAQICAGGTDLLPNMKHELHEPKEVIHLARVPGLCGLDESESTITIGAMTRINSLVDSQLLNRLFPSIGEAAKSIASPQIRNMATVGGNICLDTRCLFYNQTYFWREAIGFCLKKCGDTCHVTKTGKRCVAASSNDLATVLINLGASVEICSIDQNRVVFLNDFYIANGEKNHSLLPHELITRVVIPKTISGRRSFCGFAKLRNRQAIDFPMLSIATHIETNSKLKIESARMTVNALVAKPKIIDLSMLINKTFEASCADEAADIAQKKCIPLINICDDPNWRREMVAVYTKRAILASINRPASN